MPRYKALAALAFIGVLISAGSVGSQDPFLARSEAESAASAIPIAPAVSTEIGYRTDESVRSPVNTAYEPVADAAPHSITPNRSAAPAQTPIATAVVAASPALPAIAVPSEASHPSVPSSKAIAPVAQAVTAPDGILTEPPPALAEIDAAPEFSVAEKRLLSTVPDDIEGYFDLFMYASKSNRGPLAQRMYVFQRDPDGRLVPYAEWRISTGREKIELHHEKKIRTTTPEGVFALDPDRFHRRYFSKTWDGAPMHYAMFYDMTNNGKQSGLAIHAAVGKDKIRRLGRRDSAGCIRLAPKNAKELFYKIRNTTQGRVPAFAVNERGSTDRWGKAQRDEGGTLILQDGYRALLFVENYDGRDEVIGPVVSYSH
ncbi:MAG: L,D-transpeptidase family protein [Micropepsaceae bacterium]